MIVGRLLDIATILIMLVAIGGKNPAIVAPNDRLTLQVI
jgi:hypothetical protein